MKLSTILGSALLLLVAPAVMASPVENKGQEKQAARHVLDDPKKGARTCGNSNTADKRDLMALQSKFANNFNNCTTPAKTCIRHVCKNTSGIYTCNDNDHEVTVPCRMVSDYATDIGTNCCTKSYTESKGISGMLWSDQNWNVWVAYANCNHDSDKDHPGFAPDPNKWGPNGACEDK